MFLDNQVFQSIISSKDKYIDISYFFADDQGSLKSTMPNLEVILKLALYQ